MHLYITLLIFPSFPSPTTYTMYVLSYTHHSTPVPSPPPPPPSPFPLWYVCQVLSHGTALLSSTGEEYCLDNDPDYQNMTAQVSTLSTYMSQSLYPSLPHLTPASLTLPLPPHPLSPKLPRSVPPQEKATFYRQQLLQKLGLVAQGKVFSTGIEKFIDDSDLIITSSTRGSPQPTTREV